MIDDRSGQMHAQPAEPARDTQALAHQDELDESECSVVPRACEEALWRLCGSFVCI